MEILAVVISLGFLSLVLIGFALMLTVRVAGQQIAHAIELLAYSHERRVKLLERESPPGFKYPGTARKYPPNA